MTLPIFPNNLPDFPQEDYIQKYGGLYLEIGRVTLGNREGHVGK